MQKPAKVTCKCCNGTGVCEQVTKSYLWYDDKNPEIIRNAARCANCNGRGYVWRYEKANIPTV